MEETKLKSAMAKRRQLSGPFGLIAEGIALFTTFAAMLYVSSLLRFIDIYVMRQSYLGVMLALFLTLVFLYFPMMKRGPYQKVPWYDFLFIIVAVAGPLYYVVVYPTEMLRMDSSLLTPFEMALTLASIITILEATRRVMGLAMPLIAALFFLHALTCNWWPSFLHGRGYDLARVTTQAYLSNFGVYGVAFNVAATIIIIYILFGRLIQLTGAGEFINNLSLGLLGRVRGGTAKVSVVASGLFGSISGLATANIATTGSFTIPMMKKTGYSPTFAAAVEAAASNGGQILPPVMGLIAFLMADWLGVPYSKICLAAAIPALLYFFCLFLAVDAEAAAVGMKGLSRNELPSLARTLAGGWEYLIPPLALIFFIGIISHSPQIAGLYASGVVVFVVLFRKKGRSRITFSGLRKSLRDAALTCLMPAAACACVGVIMGSLGLTGLGIKLSSAIVDISGGILIILLILSAIASFILGMGVGMIPTYIVVASLIAPALQKVGISPLASHFYVFYFAIVSMLTPPVAVGAYVAAGIAGSDPWKTGWTAARLAIVKYFVPFLFIYSPAILGQGSAIQILVTAISAFCGTALLAWCLQGFGIRKRLPWWERLAYATAAVSLFIPTWQYKLPGLVLGLFLFLRQFRDDSE